MSSFGTQKPFGQEAVQLTFPTVFEDAVAGRMPSAYYPEMSYQPVVLEEANDVQGHYHRQKTMDAHRMAMAKVQSTVNSDRYAQQHHQNYATPAPVLSQRVYANPSNGNIADIYNNRRVSFEAEPGVWSDYSGGLSGGVLYTNDAQKWGRQQLRNRVGQLDAIDAEKQGLQLQQAPSQDAMGTESDNTKVKLEISQTLQAINASVNSGQANNFAFGDSIKFLRLLFRWATTATLDELQEVMEYCESIETSLRELVSSGEDGNDANENWVRKVAPQAEVMLDTFNKVGDYLKGMIGSADKSPAERKRVSASLVKGLGFTKLPGVGNMSAEEGANRLKELSKREQILRAQQAGLPDDAFDDEDDDSFPDPMSNYGNRSSRANSVIRGQLAQHMEEQDRLFREARFDNQPREFIGRRNGSFFGEQPDLANDVEEARVHNEFRRGDNQGEAQAQGLEVGVQEVNPFALPAVGSIPASRVGTVPPSGAITPRPRSERSGRSSSSSEAPAPAQPAVSAPRYNAQGERIITLAEYEARKQATEQARLQAQRDKPNFPYRMSDLYNTTEARIKAIARDLRDKGYGDYNPQDRSKVASVRGQLFKKYPGKWL